MKVKVSKTYIFGFIVWILAIFSLIFVHIFLRHSSLKVNKEFLERYQETLAIVKKLPEWEQINFRLCESTIIYLSDNNFYIIGAGHEDEEEELRIKGLIMYKNINIDKGNLDNLILERQYNKIIAFGSLTNQEQLVVNSKQGALLYRDGQFYLVADTSALNNIK